MEEEVAEEALRQRLPRHKSTGMSSSASATNGVHHTHDSLESSNEGKHTQIEHDILSDNHHRGSEATDGLLPSVPLPGNSPEVPFPQIRDVYLEKVYEKPVTHEFFCPNCNACIKKVILRPEPPPQCSSCFSFLIPAGNWFLRNWGPNNDDLTHDPGINPPRDPSASRTPSSDDSETTLNDKSKVQTSATLQNGTPDINKGPSLGTVGIGPITGGVVAAGGMKASDATKDKKTDSGEGSSSTIIPIHDEQTVADGPAVDRLEILRSIVYGGLAESITSLSVVTSAASADAATPNIVALALANLIGGLFIIGQNLRELKSDKQPGGTSDQTNKRVDRYQELLGKRDNFAFHATIVVLSFFVFGLVPPLVYGFSFRESDDRDYKLAVVTAASVLCITVLAIGKAHVQKPEKHYIKTILYYVVVGLMVSGISFIAGDLFKKLIEKYGWFKPQVTVTVPLGDMSLGTPARAFY